MLRDGAIIRILATNDSSHTEGKTTEFHVNKAILLNATPYFQALKNFKEGEEDAIEFRDVEPNSVSAYLYWLYTGKFPQDSGYRSIHTSISAYTFGDRILAPEFKDLIIDQVADPEPWSAPRHYSSKVLTTLQEAGLSPTDSIARYLIDHVAYSMVMQPYSTDDDDQEFFHAGGEWVFLLMQSIMRVTATLRKSKECCQCRWENVEAPSHPRYELHFRYHECPPPPPSPSVEDN